MKLRLTLLSLHNGSHQTIAVPLPDDFAGGLNNALSLRLPYIQSLYFAKQILCPNNHLCDFSDTPLWLPIRFKCDLLPLRNMQPRRSPQSVREAHHGRPPLWPGH